MSLLRRIWLDHTEREWNGVIYHRCGNARLAPSTIRKLFRDAAYRIKGKSQRAALPQDSGREGK